MVGKGNIALCTAVEIGDYSICEIRGCDRANLHLDIYSAAGCYDSENSYRRPEKIGKIREEN